MPYDPIDVPLSICLTIRIPTFPRESPDLAQGPEERFEGSISLPNRLRKDRRPRSLREVLPFFGANFCTQQHPAECISLTTLPSPPLGLYSRPPPEPDTLIYAELGIIRGLTWPFDLEHRFLAFSSGRTVTSRAPFTYDGGVYPPPWPWRPIDDYRLKTLRRPPTVSLVKARARLVIP